MNRLLLWIFLCALSYSFSSPLLARAQQIPTDRKIHRVSTYGNQAFLFFSPDYAMAQDCSSSQTDIVAITLDESEGKEMYSAAILAATQGLDVGFGVSGCLQENVKAYRIDVNFN